MSITVLGPVKVCLFGLWARSIWLGETAPAAAGPRRPPLRRPARRCRRHRRPPAGDPPRGHPGRGDALPGGAAAGRQPGAARRARPARKPADLKDRPLVYAGWDGDRSDWFIRQRPPPRQSTAQKPSRRDPSRRRRGLGATPGPDKEECDKHSLSGQFFDKERGVAAPTLAPKYRVSGAQWRPGERQSCSRVRA